MPSNKKKKKNIEKTTPHKVSKTKKVNTKKAKTPEVKKSKKRKKDKFSDKHPKLVIAFKILIIIFLLLCVIGAGIVAGMFFGLFGDEFEITKEELKIGASNSVVVDKNGAVIANLSGDEKRKVITLEDMSDYLPKAYVAIEDERYYKHSGVDFKRTAGAILNKLLGKGTYGGSTITQQLVKNITKEDETAGFEGIFRKVKEWAKAYQVERMISKDQILELYLNILYVGGEGNLHGVELGAEYYFNKTAKDLDLAECAFMAGINSAPQSYNPFNEESDNSEKIKNKTKTVLAKMEELGYIEKQEDYDAAVAKVDAGLPFSKGTTSTSSGYSYHTDAIIEQLIQQVIEEKGISRELAKNYVYSSGLKIYSTVDPNIQSTVEQETLKTKYIKPGHEKENGVLKNEHTQAAMVIIDYKTGQVLGVSGGLGEKTGSNLNRGTQSPRQPGSSIKPIADISPALQEKVITAATVYNDVLTDFNGYQPKNDRKVYKGYIGIRDIIAYSQNVPEVKIMRELTPTKSIQYLKNFGVSTLVTAAENARYNDEGLPLAIGGLTNGISPLEMAAAYSAIANDGEYIEPTFYLKVEDSDGNVVMTPNQEKRRVISAQNAYIVKSILQEPVTKGTATYCAISGMSVAAKTGTTDGSKDRWLCGFTPYYAAACWFGYDQPEEVRDFNNQTNPAGQIWDNVMTTIHNGLPKATFTKPDGIVEQTVCKITGCIATTGCTNTYKEIFTADNLPETCQGHGSQLICPESQKVATQYCSEYVTPITRNYGGVRPKENLKLWKTVGGSSQADISRIDEVCTIHTKPKEKPKTNTTNTTNTAKPTNTNTSGKNGTNISNTNGTGGSTANQNKTNNTITVNNTNSGKAN